MLPFCGYNMADYFDHWLHFREKLGYLSPKIFYVNWFRQDSNGQFIWPGFGENSRVLKWITERVDGVGKARPTPIGYLPTNDALDVAGIDVSPEHMHELLHVDADGWLKEIPEIRKYFGQFGDRLPSALDSNLDKLEDRFRGCQQAATQNKTLLSWVASMVKVCTPDHVVWCTGSESEAEQLCNQLVHQGTFVHLNPARRPNSYVARSDPNDAIRVASDIFVCTDTEAEAGPTNNWADPVAMRSKLSTLFNGCMKGRTMYVVPFCLGPLESKLSKVGVQLTDSPYAVLGLRTMAQMGTRVLNLLSEHDSFVSCMHSVGSPLAPGQSDVCWPCNPSNRLVAQFNQTWELWSYGSAYGANAILSKSCLALRLGTAIGRKEKWIASRCVIISITPPKGAKYYACALLPTSCGKSSLAMLIPTIPGWKVRCVGDESAWLYVGRDGRLYAINPEAGFYDTASSRNVVKDPGIYATISSNTIFTNVAVTTEGDVWWEGMTKQAPASLTDWQGQPWTPDCGRPAAHWNGRYLTPHSNCPTIDPNIHHPNGVPISAFIFGSRRTDTLPLVHEAYTWRQGMAMGATLSQDSTGSVKYDPFAMQSYCGISIHDYITQWDELGLELGYTTPKVFHINCFQTDSEGSVLWPGYGENARLLKWIWQRIDGGGQALRSPVGYVPPVAVLDVKGLHLSEAVLAKLLRVDETELMAEAERIQSFYSKLGGVPTLVQEALDAWRRRFVSPDQDSPRFSPRRGYRLPPIATP
mmetsp:Transcript_13039/g.23460  ORF Transcript_13039/g.23460 Transcript_13039/m.23460 type:complete len:754 (-) Transcript_13039:3532-5793(-)